MVVRLQAGAQALNPQEQTHGASLWIKPSFIRCIGSCTTHQLLLLCLETPDSTNSKLAGAYARFSWLICSSSMVELA
jgi:hypothetical protein